MTTTEASTPSDDADALRIAPDVDDRDVYPIVRLGLIVGGGLVLIGLVSVLPGLEWLLAAAPIPIPFSASALLLAAGTYLAAGGLVAIAPRVERVVRKSLEGPAGVVADAAASAKYLVVFVASAVAYRGFAPAMLALLELVGMGWLYHVAFLVAALVPLLLIARRLHRSLDPVAELLTREVTGAIESRGSGSRVSADGATSNGE